MSERMCGFCGVNPAVGIDLCLGCAGAFADDLNSSCVDVAIDALQDAEDERVIAAEGPQPGQDATNE